MPDTFDLSRTLLRARKECRRLGECKLMLVSAELREALAAKLKKERWMLGDKMVRSDGKLFFAGVPVEVSDKLYGEDYAFVKNYE